MAASDSGHVEYVICKWNSIALLLLSYLIAIIPAFKARYENGSAGAHVGKNG